MNKPPVSRDKKPADPAENPVSVEPPPLWARGLEEIYSGVVNEPLPESLRTLLEQLGNPSEATEKPDADG